MINQLHSADTIQKGCPIVDAQQEWCQGHPYSCLQRPCSSCQFLDCERRKCRCSHQCEYKISLNIFSNQTPIFRITTQHCTLLWSQASPQWWRRCWVTVPRSTSGAARLERRLCTLPVGLMRQRGNSAQSKKI